MGRQTRCRAARLHEAGFYRDEAEFCALIIPFAEEGVAAGQPVILGYRDRRADLLRSWLSDPAAVTFIAGSNLYATPARAITSYRRLFARHTAAGATQIRVAADVPHQGDRGRFAGWDRYESAANIVWDDFPVWSRCLYDVATAAPEVLDVVERTHARIVSPSGRYQRSLRYQDPTVFEPLPPEPDPLEGSAPAVELANPTAAQARHALDAIGRGHLPGDNLHAMVLGVSEAVTYALMHGRLPVTVRIWAAPGRVTARVHHTGPGPADPLAGLTLPSGRPGAPEAGLWLIHQLGINPALICSADGFTIRLATEINASHLGPSPNLGSGVRVSRCPSAAADLAADAAAGYGSASVPRRNRVYAPEKPPPEAPGHHEPEPVPPGQPDLRTPQKVYAQASLTRLAREQAVPGAIAPAVPAMADGGHMRSSRCWFLG